MGFLKRVSSHKRSSNKESSQHQHQQPKKIEGQSVASDTLDESNVSVVLLDVQVIEDYMAALNRHATAEELLQYWTSDKAKVTSDDYSSMSARKLVREISNLYSAFDNLLFAFETIKEIGPGIVMVDQLVVSGTHTAELRFMDFCVLPKTDKAVVLDPENLYFTMKNGKIQKMENCALGNLTGPSGMYQAVGGTLEKPSKRSSKNSALDDSRHSECSTKSQSKKKTSKKDGGSLNESQHNKRKSLKSNNEGSLNSESLHSGSNSDKATKPSNKQIIENYLAAKNRHAPKEELLRFFSSDKTKAKFDEYGSMTAKQLAKEICNLYEGFAEDLAFDYESIKEIGPGIVMVDQLVVRGTHTGDLKFKDFPAIPATDKSVVSDPERLYFTINKNGKIQKMEGCALGNLTGPPGMYLAVGGTLEKPSKK